MPSRADSDLARRDTLLPGLATLLEPEALSRLLVSAEPSCSDDLELLYLRYKPGTNCIAAYRAGSGDQRTLLYAKAHSADAAQKLAKAQRGPGSTHSDLPKRSLVEALGVVTFAFPDDAKLPALSRLANTNSRRRLLDRVLGSNNSFPDTSLKTLAYKPERRYVACLENGDGKPRATLKFYGSERYQSARAAGRAIKSQERLRVPRRCGGSERHYIRASEWLPGPTLREVLDSGRPVELAKVGGALAELHSQRHARLRRSNMVTRLSQLDQLAKTLGFIYPCIADASLHLAKEIAIRLGSGPAQPTTIHGDFYDKQIVLMENEVGLVDLDDAMLGDARQDLGLFVAHLERDRVMGRPLEGIDSICGALLEGYQDVAGRRVDGLSTFVAEGLFRLAHHPFRRHSPSWPDETRAILERTRELLAGVSSTP